MSRLSPYFGNATRATTVASASVSAVKQYHTRRKQTIKIEYESSGGDSSTCTGLQIKKKDVKEELENTMKTEEMNLCDNNSTSCLDIKNEEATCKKESEVDHHVKIKVEPLDEITEEINEDNTSDGKKIKKEIKTEGVIKNEMSWASQPLCTPKSECSAEVWAPGWVPHGWEILLSNIKEMRKDKTAVVDSLGCERLSDAFETPEVRRFQTFTSLLLSAMTKDQVTSAAVVRLKEHGLNVPNIAKTPETVIGKLIHPVGFWAKKASYLKKCASIFQEEYNCDIPNTVEGLIALPGFGPKMAHICMSVAWGQMTGIGVDTHVHRIANKLRWVRKSTKTPEHTRLELQSWLPRSEWRDINILLVGFGQERCKARFPLCGSCLNKDICPSSEAKTKKTFDKDAEVSKKGTKAKKGNGKKKNDV